MFRSYQTWSTQLRAGMLSKVIVYKNRQAAPISLSEL